MSERDKKIYIDINTEDDAPQQKSKPKKKSKSPSEGKEIRPSPHEKEHGKSSPVIPKFIQNDGSLDIEMIVDIFGSDVDRKIIGKLSKMPRYASDLSIDLGISKPAIKKHLDKLEEIGVIIHHDTENHKETDEKKQFYCINPNLSLSLHMDLSSNYFNYRIKNTSIYNQSMMDKLEKEHQQNTAISVSIYGDKGDKNENGQYLRKLADQTAKNLSLLQLGKAMKDLEAQIRTVENERLKLMTEKNEIVTRIKQVMNTFVSDKMELEILSSFFSEIVENMEHGVSIKKFIDDIFLQFKGTRAGVKENQITDSIQKQTERKEKLEEILESIIKQFKFIKTNRDDNTNEQNIVFEF
jgi:predicted transcriptional regulator